MKEYLVKQADGSYELVMRGIVGKDDDIEVPEGAQLATACGKFIAFWKNGAVFFIGDDKEWDFHYDLDHSEYMKVTEDRGSKIIWQRHTQPEELPFIDDGIIDCREAIQEIYKPTDFGASSLNDQYAEIEQVRQQTIDATLAERQSQYGNFEDVAFVTENIMATLAKARSNGLRDLPHTHRMALYMIASKMARIVNGDFNHLDGWHDIGGYSKLIEDLITVDQ